MELMEVVRNPFRIKSLDYGKWEVQFWVYSIKTTVTCQAREVEYWIAETLYIHRRRIHKLLVGLDTEWSLGSPENGHHQRVAIIQLCVGQRCLIFQLHHRDGIPLALAKFLGNEKITFVGKEVENDARKLLEDHALYVATVKDVSHMAAKRYKDRDYLRLGLAALVFEFLDVGMEKPKHITISAWDTKDLSEKQIQYAAIDGFVSFQLGFELMKPKKY